MGYVMLKLWRIALFLGSTALGLWSWRSANEWHPLMLVSIWAWVFALGPLVADLGDLPMPIRLWHLWVGVWTTPILLIAVAFASVWAWLELGDWWFLAHGLWWGFVGARASLRLLGL